MKFIKHLNILSPLLLFILLMAMSKSTIAQDQNVKGIEKTKPTEVSVNDYKVRLEYEKKILGGLMKLLNVKEHEKLPKDAEVMELVTTNEDLYISKETSKYGSLLFTVNANLVPMGEILYTLASISGRKLVLDEDIDNKEISSVVSIFLDHTPFVDIIDIILGSKGFESIISDDIIFVTIPAKLNVSSSYEYYQGKAVQAYQRAMIKYPNYKEIAKAYFELGNFYLTSGFPTIALQEFSVIIQKYSSHPLAKPSMFSIGRCYEKLGSIEKARQSYLAYTKRYPHDSKVADVFLIIGDLWRKQKEYEKAIATYKNVVKDFSKENAAKLALLRLGYTYIEAGVYKSALNTFMIMKKKYLLEEFRPEIEYQIGNCYYLLGKYAEAKNVLSRFILYEEDNDALDNAYYKLADCYFKQKDYLMAHQICTNALEKFQESDLSPYGYLYSGKSLRMLNMLESAKNTLRTGLEEYADSEYAEIYKFEIGLCYFDDDSFDRAFEMFSEIDNEKENVGIGIHKAKIYAGICLGREKEHERAIEYFIKALTEKGQTVQERNWIFKLIGDSYSELGRQAEATLAYQGEIL